MRGDGTITSLALPDLGRCTRQDVLDYFDNTWALTEVLFSALQGEEAFYRPAAHGLRHPLVFYYGHPAALYINKLRVAGILAEPLDPFLEQLFETGVDEMRWDDLSKNDMEWPTVGQVKAYRREVYRVVRSVIRTHAALNPTALPITMESPAWALFMGFEHERIHLETSSVLVRELPLALVRRPDAWPAESPSFARPTETTAPLNPLVEVPAADVVLGKPTDWPSYGWDNEYGRRECHVRPFRASACLVSNGEFLDFVRDKGYFEPRWWSDEGWRWRSYRNSRWPVFWIPTGPAGLHQYRLRTCFAEIDLPPSWPAEVNYHEARAFASWRTARDASPVPYRLITESEHHRLRDASWLDQGSGIARDPVMAGEAATGPLNLNLALGSLRPVHASPATTSGFHDVLGNAWEWCEDHFNPLPQFRVHPYYDDFSAPCYDGKHQMILGGSFISTGDEASIWARFHFRPHFFQHAGFRLACTADGDPTCDAVDLSRKPLEATDYESDRARNEYLLLHFGTAEEQMPFDFGPLEATLFPVRCARWISDQARVLGIETSRALDVGCAVGGATFELARTFDRVTGVDLSTLFVETAQRLQTEGSFPYAVREEGLLVTPRVAHVDPSIERTRVLFRQADACALPADLLGFDAVLAANVLDRVPSPRAVLARLGGPRGLVRPGGLLLITCPYSWQEAYAPVDAWLGGHDRGGVLLRSQDELRAALEPEFALLEVRELPLLIREHGRKFEYVVSQGMLWQRRP